MAHDCTTHGHRWANYVRVCCVECDAEPRHNQLDALLRRALTDAVQRDSINACEAGEMAFHRAMNGKEYGGAEFEALGRAGMDAMRDTLITAILTAARETNNG